MRKMTRMTGILAMMVLLSLTACSNPSQKYTLESPIATSEAQIDTGFVLTGPDSYDSADTPILVEKNKDDNTVTFLNRDLGKRYTLSVDGTTRFYDKYGESVSLEQIGKGAIVDVKFLKSKKQLTSMQLSSAAWTYESVNHYEMNVLRGEVTIGEETFKISKNTQYLSAGRNVDAMDLNTMDILTFQGIDNEVLCVTVEKGHGYLRLTNDENFIGGWIEIGQSMIHQVTQDMLLTVPEGNYQVNISHKGGGGIKDVIINRNEETVLDVGDLVVAEPSYGTILFSLTPADTILYIDGQEVDASAPVSLEYGIHQLIARAEGYQTITRYLRVGEESAGISIVLDMEEDDEEESSSGSSDKDSDSAEEETESEESTDSNEKSTDNSDSVDTVTDYYKVYVDAPEGVEVYLDGSYVGISPCNFRKQSGTHVITLRKAGYETRSYTVSIEEEDKDVSYSFVDLVESEDSE